MKKILIILFVCLSVIGNSQSLFFEQNGDIEIGCDPTVTEVTIGTQIWMRKNLAVTNYNDATGIPKVTDATEWAALTTPAYCWYNNDSATYAATYGALYNWYAVNTGKLCPTGWHVPSKTEWETLITFLGTDIAGGKLKEVGTTHWQTPNTGAIDTLCFTALPAGYRLSIGQFGNINQNCQFWNATDYNTTYSYYITITHTTTDAPNYLNYKKHGFSVRCIKD